MRNQTAKNAPAPLAGRRSEPKRSHNSGDGVRKPPLEVLNAAPRPEWEARRPARVGEHAVLQGSGTGCAVLVGFLTACREKECGMQRSCNGCKEKT